MHRAEPSSQRVWPWVLAIVVVCVLIALVVWVFYRTDNLAPVAATATTAPPTTRVPQACADALATADKLIGPGSRLAKAARAHAAVMELLEEGDITGHQAYVRGQAQVASMLHDSPDVAVFVGRYQEVRRKCPLK